MNKNSIYLGTRRKVILPVASNFSSGLNKHLVATIQKNIENLGFTFSGPVFTGLSSRTDQELTEFYEELVSALRELRGAHRTYNPMYPNFPKQVMEASEVELYVNAITHYWSFMLMDAGFLSDTWLPEYEKIERLPLDEKTSLDVIHLGSEEDFHSVFTTLLSSKTSISQSNKDILEFFMSTYGTTGRGLMHLVPEAIPLKENLTLLVALALKHTPDSAHLLSSFVKTATDVMRVAVGLSGGDVSLATNSKFAKFNRSTRRFLLEMLERTGETKEEMVKYHGKWLRLGERLHPGEFKERYPKSFAAFSAHRSGEKITTFTTTAEALIVTDELQAVSDLLQARPGEFARRLDHLFRKAIDADQRSLIASKFLDVAGRVSSPVLLQIYVHFKNRNDEADFRAVFPKGDVAKMQLIQKPLPALDALFCEDFARSIRKVLIERFKNLEPLGQVYVDERLKNYIVPFSQRSASKALRTLVRGSRLGMEGDYDTVRFFIHWTNTLDSGGEGRVDIDLSAVILDENFNRKDDLSYYNLKGDFGCHSGDITNAPHPDGASEFIDVRLSGVRKMGGRYIVMCVNSYTETPLCNLPVCLAGWMGREKPQSGEVFEPRTITNKVDLAANTTISLPMMIDVKTRQVIWMDLALKRRPRWNNVANNAHNIGLVCKAMAQMKKPNLYELFSMHAEARGRLVTNPEIANTVFSESQGVTPYDGDMIAAKFL